MLVLQVARHRYHIHHMEEDQDLLRREIRLLAGRVRELEHGRGIKKDKDPPHIRSSGRDPFSSALATDCDRGFRAGCKGDRVEIDGVRDRCNHYGSYNQLPTSPTSTYNSLDGGLFWRVAGSSSSHSFLWE